MKKPQIKPKRLIEALQTSRDLCEEIRKSETRLKQQVDELRRENESLKRMLIRAADCAKAREEEIKQLRGTWSFSPEGNAQDGLHLGTRYDRIGCQMPLPPMPDRERRNQDWLTDRP